MRKCFENIGGGFYFKTTNKTAISTTIPTRNKLSNYITIKIMNNYIILGSFNLHNRIFEFYF